MSTAIIAAAYLANSGAAQQNLKIDQRIFLTSSHSEAGLVNVIEMFEHDNDEVDLRFFGQWYELISGLKYPTYSTYDFKNNLFYICDCDEILQFNIEFDQSLDSKVKATRNGAVV